MSAAGAIKAGAAYVEMLADANPLIQGLKVGESYLQSWGKRVSAIGGKAFGGAFDAVGDLGGGAIGSLMKLAKSPAGMFGGMIAAALKAGEGGAAMLHLSKTTGIAVSQLGSLKYAAEQTGIGVEGLAGGIKFMQKNLVGAGAGSKEAVEALAAIGLSARDLQAMTPDEQLRTIARGIAAIQDPATKTATAMHLFGRAGAEMIAFADELGTLEARARELGLTGMTKETAEARESFAKLITDVKLLGSSITSSIGGAVIPVLRDYVAWTVQGLVKVRDWIKEHKALVSMAFKVSAGIVAIGGGFMLAGAAIGKIGGLIGMATSGFRLMFSLVSGGLSVVGWLFSIPSLLATIGSAVGTFLVSPLGLTVVAVAAVAAAVGLGLAAWLKWTDQGQATLAGLKSAWGDFKDDMLETWGGIVDAIAAGDLTLAFQVAMAGLSLEWGRVLSYLKDSWSSIKFVVMETWTTASGWVASTMTDAWMVVRMGFETFIFGIKTLWIQTTGWMGTALIAMVRTSVDLMLSVLENIPKVGKSIADRIRAPITGALNTAQQTIDPARRQKEATEEYSANMEGIKKQRDGAQNALKDQTATEHTSNLGTWREEETQREKDLEEKKKNLAELRERAKKERAAAEKKEPGEEGYKGGGDVPDVGKIAAAGSFSAAGAAMMGGGTPAEETATNTRELVKVTLRNERLLNRLNQLTLEGGVMP